LSTSGCGHDLLGQLLLDLQVLDLVAQLFILLGLEESCLACGASSRFGGLLGPILTGLH
jgi:hypothetical protein